MTEKLHATKPQGRPILIVENNDENGATLSKAVRQAGINHPLLRLPNSAAAELYLSGTGNFSDRKKYPLPCLILLDVTLPKLSSVEMLPWLKSPAKDWQIVVTFMGGPLDPDQFPSAVAFSPNSILCKLPTHESLADMAAILRENLLHHEERSLVAIQ